MPDHINNIERTLIDNMRNGRYNNNDGIASGSAWASGTVNVFGQYPEPEDKKYPCIIIAQSANGLDEQFMGQAIEGPSTEDIGEMYGIGFNVHLTVDGDSTITVDGEGYKQRRLINYLMLGCANVLMDTDFSGTDTEVVERHFTGWTQIGYSQEREVWGSTCSYVMTFKNSR
jgi:hypothetical protein|tara:strand:- start:294 stop:809 length:516 start_codon:yes stop_codon:yes gene_type:complete